MGYQMTEVHVEAVRVVGRFRKDLGDIESLAKSIANVGLMHPIVVTPEMQLIAGGRRLEACRLLGKQTIPALVVDNLDDATRRLTAERDENTERKPMAWSELIALGKALEALERPKAAGRRTSAPMNKRSGTETMTEGGATRDVVAKALGTGGSSYARAKAVVEAAEAPGASPAVKAIRDELDRTGNVGGAYQKLRGERDMDLGPKPTTVISGAGPQRRVISKAETALSGICHALGQITELHPDITSDEAAQWVSGLSNHRFTIERLIKRLKERTNAQA